MRSFLDAEASCSVTALEGPETAAAKAMVADATGVEAAAAKPAREGSRERLAGTAASPARVKERRSSSDRAQENFKIRQAADLVPSASEATPGPGSPCLALGFGL